MILLAWLRNHKRIRYLLIGSALFLPSWIWSDVELPSLFAGLSLLFLCGIVLPCMIGHETFRRRYRPVEISETEYSAGARWRRGESRIRGKSVTKSYRSTELIFPILYFMLSVSFIGLIAMPLFYGVPILSLCLPMGSGFLGLACFDFFNKAHEKEKRFWAKILP